MRKTVILLIFLLTTSAAFSQAKQKVVVWNGSATCGYKNFTLDNDESLTCSSIQTPRGPISVFEHDGVSLAVAFLEDDDFILVATQIRNSTTRSLDFDSDKWGAAHFKTSESFSKGNKPMVAESAIPSRDIIRGIKSGVYMDDSADNLMASITKTSETKEVRKADGTRVRKVVITQDKEAEQVAASRNSSRSVYANGEQERIRKTALTQKWVGPQADAKGIVYFRREKKAGLVVFALKIGDTTYLIRLLRDV